MIMLNLSERRAALIEAMYAAAPAHDYTVTQWLNFAQKQPGLATALRAIFSRLPTPTRLGSLLQEHIGLTTGEVTLHGRHSARSKAWRYSVRTVAETAAVERQAAEVEAEKEAKRALAAAETARLLAKDQERAQRISERNNPALVIAVAPAPPDPHAPPTYELAGTVTVGNDGRVTRDLMRGRDGQPIPVRKPEPVKAPEPAKPAAPPAAHINVTPETACDSRLPPWAREGRQPTKAELAAQHHRRGHGVVIVTEGDRTWAEAPMAVEGWEDPGGIVRKNTQARPAPSDADLDGWRYDGTSNWTKRL